MNSIKFLDIKIKQKILYSIVAILIVIPLYNFVPFEKMDFQAIWDDGASSCPYYFSLESLQASYPLLSFDAANTKWIKTKVIRFERKMKKANVTPYISQNYKEPYFKQLADLKVTSIKDIKSPAAILDVIRKTSPIIDNYNLDKSLTCINKRLFWGQDQSRRILRFNLNGLYDQIPSKYSQILFATTASWMTGSSTGLFILNQTENLDTRFMTGLPLLTALYILPKNDFKNYGRYDSPSIWSYFDPKSLNDATTRKVLDIGGIDVFTVLKADLKNDTINNSQLLSTQLNPMFSNEFQSFINTKSYGLAYIANNITYENPTLIKHYERFIKHYFARHQDPVAFTATTNLLYGKLLQLNEKGDVILESNEPLADLTSPLINPAESKVTINGIVGERAFFNADCPQKKCLFVFNVGASPGWQAFVNDTKSKIRRVNFAFLATEIPQGKSTIWFIYAPTYLLVCYFTSALTLLMIIWTSVIRLQKASNGSLT